MNALVETKHCSLDTLSVTILALRVSGKQMTLAVFRQLPICDWFIQEGGQLWGHIRYSTRDGTQIWAVISQCGVLYRRLVDHRAKTPLQARNQYADAVRLARENLNMWHSCHGEYRYAAEEELKKAQSDYASDIEATCAAQENFNRQFEMDQAALKSIQLFISM